MGLLNQLANILKAGSGAKPTVNFGSRPEAGVLPPQMVSNSRTGKQQPYAYYRQATQSPKKLQTLIGQVSQMQQLQQAPMQLQQQSEYNMLQGAENPGFIPLQGSNRVRPLQYQDYRNNIQGY